MFCPNPFESKTDRLPTSVFINGGQPLSSTGKVDSSGNPAAETISLVALAKVDS